MTTAMAAGGITKMTIGVDEVGMGALAGPVVACAVAIPPGHRRIAGVRDSKQMTPRAREHIATQLRLLPHTVAFCYPRTIDTINIYQASRKAMRRAVERLGIDGEVFVDGPRPIAHLSLPQQAIIGGDATVYAISCASILAKVFRDHMMTRYARRYPEYGFEQHKGYGTRRHYAMIHQHGACAIHRKSYRLEA